MHNLNWHLHHLNASRRLAACRELKQPRSLKWKYLAEQTVPSHFQGSDFKKIYTLLIVMKPIIMASKTG